MAEFSGGSHAEWMMEKDSGLLTVIPGDADQVTGVVFITTIADQQQSYELSKNDDGHWTATKPELATALLMGDAVKVELKMTTEDGEQTVQVKHHAH